MVNLLSLGALLAGALAAEPEPPLLSLDEALSALDEQSLSIRQARARSDEAAAVARQAAAPLLPSLIATASTARNSGEAKLDLAAITGRPAAPTLTLQAAEQSQVNGALRIPLVVPSGWWNLAAAREGARAAGASAEAARLQIRAGFVQAAYVATATEELVQAGERAVESASEFERSAARRLAAGTAPPLDHLRAQTERIRRESDLAKARADLGRARLALGVLLAREEPVRVSVPLAQPGAPDAEPLVGEALGRRPELEAAMAQRSAAVARVDSARARLAPQLSGTLSAFAADFPYATGEQVGWRASLDFSWELFDGGLRYGKRREAGAQLAAAEAASSAARLQVIQEVRDGARDVAVATERLRLAEQQRRLAADAAASAKRSFEAGVASSLDVVDANDRLYQSDVGLAEARARLGISRVSLSLASGAR